MGAYASAVKYAGPSLIPASKTTLVAADLKGLHGCNANRLVRFTISNKRGTFALGTTRSDKLGRAVVAIRTRVAPGGYTLRATAVGSRSCAAAATTARVTLKKAMSAVRGSGKTAKTSFSLKTNSKGVGTLNFSAPKALQVIGRTKRPSKTVARGSSPAPRASGTGTRGPNDSDRRLAPCASRSRSALEVTVRSDSCSLRVVARRQPQAGRRSSPAGSHDSRPQRDS